MAPKTDPSKVLSKVQVSKPCPANWREMRGDAKVRHCTHCALNVYNISEMSREEAADLIQKTEGRLCIRYFSRADGTIITKDCPQGMQAGLRQTGRTAAVATLVFGLLGLSAILSARPPDSSSKMFFSDMYEKILALCGFGQATMGDVGTIAPPVSSPPVSSPVTTTTTSKAKK